jgi:ferredoxin
MWRHSRDISLSAHGYAKALQNGATANEIAAELWSCSLCGACDPVCPEQIDLTGMILKLRGEIIELSKIHDTVAPNPLPSPPPLGEGIEPSPGCPANSFSDNGGGQGEGKAVTYYGSINKLPQIQTLHTTKFAYASRQSVSMLQVGAIILPGPALRKNPDMLARIGALSGSQDDYAIAEDDGTDISLSLESGAEINSERLQCFLDSLRSANKIIVTDGLLLSHLKHWLPEANPISMGEALSSHSAVRRNLRTTDLYVIEPRAYHADYQRLVKHYDRLRIDCGGAFNLDLQRIAIPVNFRGLQQRLGLVAPDDEEQASWVLHGRRVSRIVVECLEDRDTLEKITNIPVVHLSELLAG